MVDRDFNIKEGGWFPIANEIAEKLMTYELTKIEYRLLWIFLRFSWGKNSSKCELRWKEIREKTKLGDGSLSKGINRLKDRNILKTSQMESKTAVTYKVNSKISTWKPLLSIRKDFPYGKQTLSKREVNTSQTESTHLLYKDNIKTIKDISAKNGFGAFWDQYPIKKGKQKAFEKWHLLKKKNKLPSIEIILKAVQDQITEKENLISQDKFCPEWKYPSTWLNQCCWDDECDIKPQKTKRELWLERQAKRHS